MIQMNRLPIKILPSSRRTLVRPFVPSSDSQVEHILFRVFSTSKEDRNRILESIYDRIEVPLEMTKNIFRRHYEHVKHRIPTNL